MTKSSTFPPPNYTSLPNWITLLLVIMIVPPSWSFLATTTTHSLSGRNPLGMVEIPKGPAPLFIVTEDEDGNVVDAIPLSSSSPNGGEVTNTQLPPKDVPCPNCDLCDGSGRISGGIGAVLDWWPIKAYRPCPNFIERGGKYNRSGQGLDEIAFGRDSKFQKE
jgi:hypothetical protein